MDALVELPSREAFRRVRSARLALEVRAPAGTGVVWTPITIGAVPEEMDFEESIRRRFSSVDPSRLAELYGHAWAQRRAAVLAHQELEGEPGEVVDGASHIEVDDSGVGDDGLLAIEECERCQMRQRLGAGRCARCAADAAQTRPAARRPGANDVLALMVAAVVVFAVICWTVIALQRSGTSNAVDRCARVVGDSADIAGC